jgi:hypothetical protein
MSALKVWQGFHHNSRAESDTKLFNLMQQLDRFKEYDNKSEPEFFLFPSQFCEIGGPEFFFSLKFFFSPIL